MALHVNIFATLSDHSVDPFVPKMLWASFGLLYVMTFGSLMLTPFCMDILGVKKWIFQCF